MFCLVLSFLLFVVSFVYIPSARFTRFGVLYTHTHEWSAHRSCISGYNIDLSFTYMARYTMISMRFAARALYVLYSSS